MEQNMFIRILNSEMELATGCTEPGAVALTAAEAGQALRKAGVDKAEEITVNASINIIKNAMSAGIPGTDYEGMDYAAAIGALGGDPVYLLEVMNHVPRETVEAAAALVKAGKVRVNVAQVPQKLYIEVIAKGGGHTGRAIVRDLHTNVVLGEKNAVSTSHNFCTSVIGVPSLISSCSAFIISDASTSEKFSTKSLRTLSKSSPSPSRFK